MQSKLPDSTIRLRAAAPPDSFKLSGEAVVTFSAASAGEKSRPSFTIRAYNGGPLNLGFGAPIIVDLRGMRAKQKTPILLDHDSTQIVGQTVKVEKAKDSIDVSGNFTGDVETRGEPAQKVVEHARNGFTWGASIGFNVERWESLDADTTAKVNGREFEGPAYIARQSRLAEISFVAAGADEDASAKVAASAALETDMSFSEWLKAKGWVEADLTDAQKETLQAAFDSEQKPAEPAKGKKPSAKQAAASPPAQEPAPVQRATNPGVGDDECLADYIARRRKLEADEDARVAGIRAACNGSSQKLAEIQAQAIREGWSVEKAELAALRAERPQVPGVRVGTGSPATNAMAICASVLMHYRLVAEDKLAKMFGEPTMEAARSDDLRGMGLRGLLSHVAAAAGRRVHAHRFDNESIREAFKADAQLRASGMSTLSLSGILGNVANKYLDEQRMAADSVVSQISAENDVPDFKQTTRYRVDSTGQFTELGKDGELKHIGLTESSYVNQLKTYGGKFVISRQDWYNDDLGAFMQMLAIFAKMAITCREKAAFTKLLANTNSFFGTGNKNYASGANSTLDVIGLNKARQLFREMKDAGNNFIMKIPRILLVPAALETDADRLITSDFVNEATDTNKPKAVNNPHKGLFTKVVSPWLGTVSGLTNASDTGWYLAASPDAGSAMLQISYLAGQGRSPTIENGTPDFDTLGLPMRAFWDFGVELYDPKAGVLSAGA